MRILLVADANLVARIVFGEVGDGVQLIGARVPRRAADRLQRSGDDRITRLLMRRDVGADERGEALVLRGAPRQARAFGGPRDERRRGEKGADTLDIRR